MNDISLVKIESLVKIGKIIDLTRIKPISFKQFSANIIPGTGSAFGFNLEESHETFSHIEWFMLLKLVNASKNSLIIENIEAECSGKNGYICKSIFTQVYRASENNEVNAIKELLLKKEKDVDEKKKIFLPFPLRTQSEEIIRVDFLLHTYKLEYKMRFLKLIKPILEILHKLKPISEIYQKIFLKLKPISFKRQEIKEPETYQQLLQKAVIKIKINENPKPLLLEIGKK